MNQNQMMYMNQMMQPTGIAHMGGPMGGTPITKLRPDMPPNMNNNQYQQQPQQTQQSQYHNDQTEESHESNNSKMKQLVNDINDDSDFEKPISNTDTDLTDTDSDRDKKKKKKNKRKSYAFEIPEAIKDPILIWIIYMIMSQQFFRDLCGKYITSINPDDTGKVSLTGIALYGALLSVLFMVTKFILRQFNKY